MAVPPEARPAAPRARGARLRTVAIAAAILVILLVVGGVGGVAVGVLPNPFKLTVAQVAAKVKPSVVSVKASVFRDGTSEGLGFFFGKPGHIVINAHVLTRATSVSITDASGKTFEADVAGIDRPHDIAELLTFDTAPKPLVGAHDAAAVGSEVVVVGNPPGVLTHGVTHGLVAGTNRELTVDGKSYDKMIQTDAAADPADSGGPMVNFSGELLGMVVAGGSGRAFAIPLPTFDSEVASWAATGNSLGLGPPLVSGSAQSLLLSGVGPSYTRITNEAWGATGWHSAWTKPASYTYGGTAVDIYLEVVSSETRAKTNYQFYLTEANNRGFTNPIAGSGLGDESTAVQHIISTTITYEVIWRDRNCVAILFLGASRPPFPDVSMPTALGLAVQQESPIGANLSDYQ